MAAEYCSWQEQTCVYRLNCCASEDTKLYGATLVLQATVMDPIGAVVGQRGECMSAWKELPPKQHVHVPSSLASVGVEGV